MKLEKNGFRFTSSAKILSLLPFTPLHEDKAGQPNDTMVRLIETMHQDLSLSNLENITADLVTELETRDDREESINTIDLFGAIGN